MYDTCIYSGKTLGQVGPNHGLHGPKSDPNQVWVTQAYGPIRGTSQNLEGLPIFAPNPEGTASGTREKKTPADTGGRGDCSGVRYEQSVSPA